MGFISHSGVLRLDLDYLLERLCSKQLLEGARRLKKDMVELVGQILDRKAGHFDPSEFKDEYELALRKLVKRKAAGHTIEAPEEEPPPTNVINLMDALRESMKSKQASTSGRSGRSSRSGREKKARRKAA
jgi:non-homologous end joining protein Ku